MLSISVAPVGLLTIGPLPETHLEAWAQLEVQLFSNPWSRALCKSHLNTPESLTLSAFQKEGRRLFGFLIAKKILNEIHLEKIAVVPQLQRRGLASLLLAQLCQGLNKESCTFYLEVSSKNPAAIAFYQGLGFEPFAVRKDYYRKGEDGCLYQADQRTLTQRLEGKLAQTLGSGSLSLIET